MTSTVSYRESSDKHYITRKKEKHIEWSKDGAFGVPVNSSWTLSSAGQVWKFGGDKMSRVTTNRSLALRVSLAAMSIPSC